MRTQLDTEIAHTHAERLSRLVDDLLQLFNLETARLVLQPDAWRSTPPAASGWPLTANPWHSEK
jgi:hypothetical protein